jgi:hypothetical protein
MIAFMIASRMIASRIVPLRPLPDPSSLGLLLGFSWASLGRDKFGQSARRSPLIHDAIYVAPYEEMFGPGFLAAPERN